MITHPKPQPQSSITNSPASRSQKASTVFKSRPQHAATPPREHIRVRVTHPFHKATTSIYPSSVNSGGASQPHLKPLSRPLVNPQPKTRNGPTRRPLLELDVSNPKEQQQTPSTQANRNVVVRNHHHQQQPPPPPQSPLLPHGLAGPRFAASGRGVG